MSFLKPLVMTKKRFKFQVSLYIDELNSIASINGFLYCKVRLRNGGTYVDTTPRSTVMEHCVSWRSKFTYTCKMSANPDTGILDPCIARLSIRKEIKGGRSADKVGYVDLNLAEFAGSGQTSRHCLLEGYDEKNRLDNSILKIVVGMQLLSGDILFKTPTVRDVAFQLPNGNHEPEPKRMDSDSSGFGSLPRNNTSKHTAHSRNESSVSQHSKRSDYSSHHSRTPSNISQTNSLVSLEQDNAGGPLKSPTRVPGTPGRMPPPPRPPPPHGNTISLNRMGDTRVSANDVVSKLIESQDFTHNTSGSENDNLQLYVSSDGKTALSGQTLHNRVGSGVYHPVVFESKTYGGAYKTFRQSVTNLMRRLRQCCVTPLIVFDGGSSQNKEETQLERHQRNVNIACKLSTQRGNSEADNHQKLLPLLAVKVFQQSLEETQTAFVCALDDADRCIVSLANRLQAPVLSNDSDFYVFDVKFGYLPLAYFHWNEVLDFNRGNYMHGLCYNRQHFVSSFKLTEAYMAFLPIVLGSDWIPRDLFAGFLAKLALQTSTNQKKARGKKKKVKPNKIEVLLQWLAQHKTVNHVLEKLVQEIPEDLQEIYREKMEWCLDAYLTVHTESAILQSLQERYKGRLPALSEPDNQGADKEMTSQQRTPGPDRPHPDRLTPEIASLITAGGIPSFLASLFTNNCKLLLPVQVTKKSPNRNCSQARRATYRLLLARGSIESDDVTITEYDRVKSAYQQTASINRGDLAQAVCCQCLDTIASQIDNSDVTIETREKYLRHALLGCDESSSAAKIYLETIEEIRIFESKQLRLHWMSLLSWMRQPRPVALALSILLLFFHGASLPTDAIADVTVDDVNLGDGVDDLGQWQSVLQLAIVLNSILNLGDSGLCDFDCETIWKVYHVIEMRAQARKEDDHSATSCHAVPGDLCSTLPRQLSETFRVLSTATERHLLSMQ